MNVYAPGTRIGPYEVAGRPLVGGMGIVYVCRDLEQDHPVALKTFKPEYLPDQAARDRFLREGTAWVDLGVHPHIVRCYRVFHIDPEVYLVLELIAKEAGREDASLRSWLTPGQPLPVEQALLFALQIARGMAHTVATIPGFVHRDLKPENVLVGADRLAGVNRLRVTDFGLAAVVEAGSKEYEAGSQEEGERDTQYAARDPLSRTQLTHGVVGTPPYMAPEQWRGEPVSTATDVYALGCILHEMLSGQRAAEGGSLAALEQAHCQGERRPLPGSLPRAVGEVVQGCLTLESGRRYGEWGSVEAALVAAYEQVAGQSAPEAQRAQALSRAERVATGWSYNAIGISYMDLGKADVAAGYFQRAGEVAKRQREQELAGAVLGNLGLAYAALGEVRHAIGYHEQALAIARAIGDRHGEGAALGSLGSAYLHLGEVQRAIGYYEQRLVIVREIGDQRGEGKALMGLGNAYAALGEARRAIGYYEQGLTIQREMRDRRGERDALGNLAIAYAILGEARRAIGYFEQRLQIAREIGDRGGEGTTLGNLGSAYRSLGEAQRASGYYEQQLAITREIGDRRGEGNALMGLGNVYAVMGDARRAISYYEQSLGVSREVGDIYAVASTSFNMALLYGQQDEAGRALPLAQEAARIFAQIGHVEYARQAQQLAAQLQDSGTVSTGPSPAQILENFGPLIEAVVAGTRRHTQARAAVEADFERLEQNGWRVAEPIRRIWGGERDAAKLTAGIDANSALIVREILKRL